MGKYAENAQKTAKERGLCLVVLEINGKFAKESSASATGPVGPKMMKRVWKLFKEMCDQTKRMQ